MLLIKTTSVSIILVISSIVLGNEDTSYTPAEKDALKQFHEMVEDVLYLDYQKKDSFLIHWIRDSNLNLNRAKQRLVDSFNWRKQNGIDSILTDKEMRKMVKLFPRTSEGVDKEGRPIFSLAFISWDIRKFMLAGKGAYLTRYIDFLYEETATRIRTLANSTQSDITQWVLLVDMNGYNLRQHACLACLPFYFDLIQHYDQHYPNKANAVILINTNRIFDNLLQILLPIMSPSLQKVLSIYSHDKLEWSAVLSKTISPDQLPSQFS